jgi:hypothetical protein
LIYDVFFGHISLTIANFRDRLGTLVEF